jgi:hypothetical protein
MLPDGRIFGQIAQNRPQTIILGRKKMVAVKQPIFFQKWQKRAGQHFRQIYEGKPLYCGISSAPDSKLC